MKNFKKLSMKTQLFCLLLLFSLLLLTNLGINYFFNMQLLSQNAKQYLDQACTSMEAQISDTLKETRNFSLYTAYSTKFQDYLMADSYQKKYELSNYMRSDLFLLMGSSSFIVSAEYLSPEGEVFLSRSGTSRPIYGYGSDVLITHLDFISKWNGNSRYSGMLQYKGKGTPYVLYAEKVYSTQIDKLNSSPEAYMFLLCSTEHFNTIFQNAQTDEKGIILLMDGGGNVFACNKTEYCGKQIEDLGFGKGGGYLEKEVPVSGTDWSLYVRQPDQSGDAYSSLHLTLVCVTVALSLFLFLLFSLIFYQSVVRPLSSLVSQMNESGTLKLKKRVSTVMENEIGALAGGINQLLDEIEENTRNIFETQDKLYTAQLLKTKTEFEMLQNKINPHFLYNTLECLRSIGDAYGVNEVSQISLSMAKIFRYCIKGDDIVTLRDELEISQEYFTIMQIRYQGRFSLHLDIGPGLENTRMIKMILQPLIENAIYHGLEAREGDGALWIGAKQEDSRIILTVRDNGAGMAEEELSRLRSILYVTDINQQTASRSVGLRNIWFRVYLRYGKNCGIDIQSQPWKGTTVTLWFPCEDGGQATLSQNQS